MELQEFTTLVMPLRPKLQNIARSMLINEADAEDAVQETLLKAWTLRLELAIHPNAPAFIMQMLKNKCIDKIRSMRIAISIDNVYCVDESPSPYKHTEQQDAVSVIKKFIDTLPELQRMIIGMRDIEGYELTEIAVIIGAETSAVTMNLSRARKKVREMYMRIHKEMKQEN